MRTVGRGSCFPCRTALPFSMFHAVIDVFFAYASTVCVRPLLNTLARRRRRSPYPAASRLRVRTVAETPVGQRPRVGTRPRVKATLRERAQGWSSALSDLRAIRWMIFSAKLFLPPYWTTRRPPHVAGELR